MATQKCSNFSIFYILGDSDKQTPKSLAVDHPSLSQNFSGHSTKVDILCQDGSRGHGDHAALMMNFPSSSWAGMCSCCVPVAYYQTAFNSKYAGQQWPFSMYAPGCDKPENHCHQTAPQRQRSRVRTKDSQTQQLHRLFTMTDYPTIEVHAELAKSTGLSEETVRVWFKIDVHEEKDNLSTCPGKSTKRVHDLLQESD